MDFGSKAIQREVEAQDKSQAISLRFVENKGQLDATDGSLLQNLFFAQNVSGTVMPIIRSSRILYRCLLPVVLGVLVYRLSVWCGAIGYVSSLRNAAQLKSSLSVLILCTKSHVPFLLLRLSV